MDNSDKDIDFILISCRESVLLWALGFCRILVWMYMYAVMYDSNIQAESPESMKDPFR